MKELAGFLPRTNLSDIFRELDLEIFPPKVMQMLDKLNDPKAPHLDYVLKSAIAVHLCRNNLIEGGYNPTKLKQALLLSDIGKVTVPTAAKIYQAGKVRRECLELPIGRALYDLGVSFEPEDLEQLQRLGFYVDKTPLGLFYTKAHLDLGRSFLSENLPQNLYPIIRIALSHHFSQGFHEFEVYSGKVQVDPDSLRHVAMVECLDKVEAGITRQDKTLPDAVAYAVRLIDSGLERNYPSQRLEFAELYHNTFAVLERAKVFSGLVGQTTV